MEDKNIGRSLEKWLKPGGEWRMQAWLAPYDGGERCRVWAVDDPAGKVRECLGDMDRKEADGFVEGWYAAMQSLIDIKEEEDDPDKEAGS